METVIVKKEDGIATIVLNRPEKLNAITGQSAAECLQALEEAEEDDEVRVVILTGAGRGFCTGFDLEVSVGETSKDFWKLMQGVHKVPLTIRNMTKPVIAAVNGAAVGYGCNLALGCDIIIASEKARFGQVFVLRGLQPDCGGEYFLPRLVGVAKACELILTGRMVDATEAERIGMINRVVPADQLESAAKEIARTIAEAPRLGISASKAAIYQALSMDLPAVLEHEAEIQSILVHTKDFKEAAAAFMEKRKPVFTGE